jgi:hypothetical protein
LEEGEIMTPLLIKIGLWLGNFVWHNLKRFTGIFLIGAVFLLVYTKYTGFKFRQYEIGYKAGYSQAVKDHPSVTVQSGGVANLNQDPKGLFINIWKFHLGGWWK